jgi:hypothetical protein
MLTDALLTDETTHGKAEEIGSRIALLIAE